MASAKGARNAAVFANERLFDSMNQQFGELDKGYAGQKSAYEQGNATLGNLVTAGQGGLSRYQDLAGTNGSVAATTALQGTPGYQWAFDQGMNALNRRRAAGGMLNSGNADTDAMKYGQGLASQTLAAERAAQVPLMNMWQQGTAGQAQGQYKLGDLTGSYFGQRAGMIDDYNKNVTGMQAGALKAGDEAKNANQQMMLSAIQSGVSLLGGGMGGGMGGLTKLFGA